MHGIKSTSIQWYNKNLSVGFEILRTECKPEEWLEICAILSKHGVEEMRGMQGVL